ncbi:MAG: hypothetical protein JW892_17295 [Anaerolineae bacterium]|nr:hypothetical protein [Anaerolineae bacterium]
MKSSFILRIILSIATLSGGLLLTQKSSAAALPPLPPVNNSDGSLGLCYAFYDDTWMQLAGEAGARWDRFDFRWNAIETAPGIYNFSGHEAILQRYNTQGIPMNVVGILGSPAVWGADCPAIIRSTPPQTLLGHIREDSVGWRPCLPKGLYSAWNDPENLWAVYVTQVVEHFNGQVSTWEIWNEPDLTSYWLGTPQDYVQLLKVGYLAAKEANPSATILFGGLAYWGNPAFYRQVLNLLAADPEAAAHNYYFDVMSLHLYSNVYQAHDIAAEVTAAMQATVGPHPLWLTETGVPLWNEDEPPTDPNIPWPPPYTATANEAAAYMIEAYANARAAGVERFFVFRLHDDHAGMGQRYGITRDDHSLRPAYIAYQVAAAYLRDAEEVVGPFRGSIHRVTFLSAAHGRTDVIWNSTSIPRTFEEPAFSSNITLITHEGLTSLLAPTGTYTLPLGAATANENPLEEYMIGGPPLLLAYGDLGDTQPPLSTLNALPTHTLPGTLALTWIVTDTQTGYWYAEIQAARSDTGPWNDIAGAQQTVARTRFVPTTITESGPWYFRARTRDQAGNWEPWPATAEISTTLRSTRLVTVTVSAFSDLDGDGIQDEGESNLEEVAFAWRDATGAEVASYTGAAWTVAQEVPFGDYEILILKEGYLTARIPLDVALALEPLHVQQHQGLLPIRGQSYLPLVLRKQ